MILKIISLELHHDELNVLPRSFESTPEIIASTETQITANDPIEMYDLEGCQPIRSEPRLQKKRRSEGSAS